MAQGKAHDRRPAAPGPGAAPALQPPPPHSSHWGLRLPCRPPPLHLLRPLPCAGGTPRDVPLTHVLLRTAALSPRLICLRGGPLAWQVVVVFTTILGLFCVCCWFYYSCAPPAAGRAPLPWCPARRPSTAYSERKHARGLEVPSDQTKKQPALLA